MRDRIADHAIHAGCHIDLFDPVHVSQFLCGDLPCSGFLARTGRSESEDTARAHSQERG